jgi:hypothetical protein
MAGKLIANDRLWRVVGKLAVVLCIFALPGSAHAANNCPWINEATVSGLLDGQAIGSFNQGPTGQPATCSFVFKEAGGTRTVDITVETVQDAHSRVMSMTQGCKQPREVLPAIGNEAYVCTTEHGKDAMAERVVGRVRDQFFTISFSTTGKGNLILSPQDLRTRISTVSEQVSGNLF